MFPSTGILLKRMKASKEAAPVAWIILVVLLLSFYKMASWFLFRYTFYAAGLAWIWL